MLDLDKKRLFNENISNRCKRHGRTSVSCEPEKHPRNNDLPSLCYLNENING